MRREPSPVRPCHARSWQSIAVLCALLLDASAAEAGDSVKIPPDCGTEEEFSRELERLLGAQVAGAHPLSLVITPRDAAGAYTLRLQLRNETRELRDDDCRALFRSAVVIAAASVRPDLAEVPPATIAEPPPAPSGTAPAHDQVSGRRPSAGLPDKVAPPAQASRNPIRVDGGASGSDTSEWRASLHGGAGVMVGLLPGLAPMLELGGTTTHGRWGVSGAVHYLPQTRSEKDERGVELWALGGPVAIVFEPREWLRFSAGIAVYWLEGAGFGAWQNLTDHAWCVAPMVEATFIALHTLDLRVELSLQGYRSIVRPRFEIGGFGEIYRVPPFAGGVVARVAFRL